MTTMTPTRFISLFVIPALIIAAARTEVRIGSNPFRMNAAVAPLPNYPDRALAARQEGSVSIRINLNTAGKVVSTEVLDATDSLFAASVKEAVAQWLFEPVTSADRSETYAANGQLTFRFLIVSGQPVVVDVAAESLRSKGFLK